MPTPGAPFLRAFNGALLITGVVAVVAMLGAAALVANRLTRPLREVAGAARRLGQGDLTVRARGGQDAESAELATAFNGMAERLERSEALRRRAASDLAHDLATPATVLESQVQAMVDGVVPADAAQLEKARTAAAALSSLIGQLGELTQAEAAPLQRKPEPVDLAALAREIVDANEGLLRERDVTATVEARRGGHRQRRPRPGRARAAQRREQCDRALAARWDGPHRARCRATARRSASPTRVPASPRTTCRSSSSASTERTGRAAASRAAASD